MYEEEETFSVSSSPLQEHKGNSPRRSSRFGRRFFRNRKSNRKAEIDRLGSTENPAEKRENSPTFQLTATNSRDSVSTSSRSKAKYGANGVRMMEPPHVTPRTRKVLSQPPPASEAAFGGPPRYDWIDIETAAAVRVQAVYRRDKTMRELEKQGITTVAIRNRARTRQRRRPNMMNGDMSSLFCCGAIGFSLDDFTPDDYEAQKEYQKSMYQQKKKSKQQREAQLRHDFAKPLQYKRQEVDQVGEVYEVVE